MEYSELLAKAEPVLTIASQAKDSSEAFSDAVSQAMEAVQETHQRLEEALAARSEATESIERLECAMKRFDASEYQAVLSPNSDHSTEPESMEISMLRCYFASCQDDLRTVKQQYRLEVRHISEGIRELLQLLEAL